MGTTNRAIKRRKNARYEETVHHQRLKLSSSSVMLFLIIV